MKNKKELLDLLDDTQILYRESLGLKKTDYFGIEIEYYHAYKDEVDGYCEDRNDYWKSVEELSIDDMPGCGGEVVSPILSDRTKTWNNISEVLSDLKSMGAQATNVSGHIHFDATLMPFNIETYYYLFKLWSLFETEIFQFSMGESNQLRESHKAFAMPIKNNIYKHRNNIASLLKHISKNSKDLTKEELFDLYIDLFKNSFKCSRFNSLSIFGLRKAYSSLNNTIEVRIPNGTLEKEIWQNNINFFATLLKYFHTDFDKELIDYYYKAIDYKNNDLDNYNIDHAILLSDIIFKDEIDKLYFMKQYTRGLKKI